jgi:hypothetical protein
MRRPSQIATELKSTSITLQEYVAQIEKENLKLQKEIGRAQAKYVAEQNKNMALKQSQAKVKFTINYTGGPGKK